MSSFIPDYNGGDFSDSDGDSILAECKYVMNLFQKSFGKMDSTYLRFVIAPFNQGGYSRKNFVCMRSKNFNLNTAKGIAHEIAHFWWNNAVTTTWEDWLNEAFAEYSMLLYIRERKGLEEFNKQIADYKIEPAIYPLFGGSKGMPRKHIRFYMKKDL